MIDKSILQFLKGIKREYSKAEALLSFQIDLDCGCKWSYSGYSKLWGWSRNKVRSFVENLLSNQGQERDSRGTPFRHPIHALTRTNPKRKDSVGTEDGQGTDTTSNPNPNPNPIKKKKSKKKQVSSCVVSEKKKVNNLKPSFFSQEEWEELYKHRTTKKASQTVRAYISLIEEFKKAHAGGMSADDMLNAMSSGKGWAGFKYEWIVNNKKNYSQEEGNSTLSAAGMATLAAGKEWIEKRMVEENAQH